MNNTKALTDVDISTSFDNIFANNSGTVRQINKATLFEALESAEDYQALKSEVNTLQESVNGIDTTTDTTLTKTGKAADAKITGDKLAALKEKDDAVDAEIGSLKESLSDYVNTNNSRFEEEIIDNGSTIKNTSIDYNNANTIALGIGITVKTDYPIVSIVTKIKASANDNLICSILKNGAVICSDSKPVTTDLSDIAFKFPQNYVNGIVTIRLKTQNDAKINYSVRSNGFTSDIMPQQDGQYFFEQYNGIKWLQSYETKNTLLLYIKSKKNIHIKREYFNVT